MGSGRTCFRREHPLRLHDEEGDDEKQRNRLLVAGGHVERPEPVDANEELLEERDDVRKQNRTPEVSFAAGNDGGVRLDRETE